MIWDFIRTEADGLRDSARKICTIMTNERNNRPYMVRPPEAAVLFNLADRLHILAFELEEEFGQPGNLLDKNKSPGPEASKEEG